MPPAHRRSLPSLLCLLLVPAVVGHADSGEAAPPAAQGYFQVTTLAPDLLMLSTDQGSYSNNSLVFTGKDGVLLVDTHHGDDVVAFKKYVESLGYGPPTYIVNTHRHVEHIGGNAAFGAEPIIVSHHLMPEKLRSGTFLFNEYPREAFPDITFTDSMEIRFNGETVRLVAIGGSHDDNEIMVYFVNHGIAHASSVVNGFNFPSVDSDGDALQFEAVTRRLMTLLPRGTRLVSGHNGEANGFGFVGSWDMLPAYADMMRTTVAIVRNALADGQTEEQMKQAGILDAYSDYAGSYVDTAGWIATLVHALTVPRDTRSDICKPVYESWKAEGARAAVRRYRELLAHTEREYDFNEYQLTGIGVTLYSRSLYEDAVEFLLGSLELYPESEIAYYTHFVAAESLDRLGRHDLALEHCTEAVRLEPDFRQASELLRTLQTAKED